MQIKTSKSDGKWFIGILVAVIVAAFGVIWSDINGVRNNTHDLIKTGATLESDVKHLIKSVENIPLKSDIDTMSNDMNQKLEVIIKQQTNTRP